MALVEFIATSASLSTGVGEDETGALRLSYRVRLAQGEHVKLATDENLNDLNGHVGLITDATSRKYDSKTVGGLWYFKSYASDFHWESASYIVEVCVSPTQHAELVAAARHGRVPSSIMIEADGLKYGGLPDGSRKTWDNKNSPILKVTKATFAIPLVGPAPGEDAEESFPEESMPPTRAQFTQLAARLDRLTSLINKDMHAIFWAIVVLGALLLYFKGSMGSGLACCI